MTQNIAMPHQWMEGNLPVSAKCSVCDKTCGSVLRWVIQNKKRENRILNHFFCFSFTMNDVDFKTGAACGVGPWFTRLAAHNTPYVVHWVLAGSASSRPQLYTASVRIHTPYTFEWCQSGGRRKYKQKGKLGQIHTHTPRRSTHRGRNVIYTHTERENIGSTAHNDAFDFLSFWTSKDGRNRGRGVIVESLGYIKFLCWESENNNKKRPAQINSSLSLCEPRTSYIERLSNDIGLKVTLHVKIKFGLIVFSLCVWGFDSETTDILCVDSALWISDLIYLFIYLSNHSGTDEAWEAVRPQGCSPLLVFVNSKSGDNQGVKFLRRFKQLLNPAQVFDLMNGGPGLGWEKIFLLHFLFVFLSFLSFLSFFQFGLTHVCLCVLLTDWGYSGTLIHSGSWFAAVTDLLVGSFPKSTSSIWMWVLFLSFFFPSPCLIAQKSDDWAAHTQHTHTHTHT